MMHKKYTLRIRAVDKDIFEAIREGKKPVETRAATSKYRSIQKGDVVVLVCGKARFQKKVREAHIFKNITTMLKKYRVQDIMPHISSVKELQDEYYGFPNYREKIKKFGLIALELE